MFYDSAEERVAALTQTKTFDEALFQLAPWRNLAQ